jgi:hypothetical protein
MAFPEKKKMPRPEPKKPDVVVAIGAGKPKSAAPDLADDSTPPKPPSAPDDVNAGGGAADSPADEASEKMSPERAIVIRENEHCRNCENYHPEDGSCEAVEGVFAPEDACYACFEPIGDEQQPDAGGPPSAGGGPMPPPGPPQP